MGFGDLHNLLIIASSWLFLASVSLFLAKHFGLDTASTLISVGVVTFLSFYLTSITFFLSVHSCSGAYVTVAASYFLLFATAAVLLLTISGRAQGQRRMAPLTWARNLASVISVFSFFTIMAVAFHSAYVSPVFAFDVLGLWPEPGYAALAVEMAIRLSQDCTEGYEYIYRHPPAIVAMIAWITSVSLNGHPQGLIWWPFAGVSTCLVVLGASLKITNNWVIGGLSVCALVMTPLYENHLTSPGYAEPIILGSITITAALVLVASREKKVLYCAVALCTAVLPHFTKEAGILYSIPLLACVAICIILIQFGTGALLSIGLIIVISMFFGGVFGVDLTSIGLPIRWDPQSNMATVGSRSAAVSGVDFGQIAANLRQSLFANMSFSLAFLTIGITLALGVSVSRNSCAEDQGLFIMYALLTTSLFLAVFSTQFTNYIVTAMPGNDTGGSRYILPIIGLSALAPCLAYALLRRSGKDVLTQ